MILGVDGNEANVKNPVGSNVYAQKILERFSQLSGEENKVNIYLKKQTETTLPKTTENFKYKIFGPSPLWTQWRLPAQLYWEKLTNQAPDIFFTPSHYAPRFCPVPSVVSIMDLAFLKFPQEFKARDLRQLTNWTAYSVKKATHIFAISQSTKQDIMKTYNIPAEKITVTYLGKPDLTKISRAEKDRDFSNFKDELGITQPYIIYVGTLQPRKNILRLIDAFMIVKKQSVLSQLKLVLVGKKGWLYTEIFEKVKTLGIEQEVIFTDYVSDWEKAELIRYSQVLVLPSLYEGFGLPILEAFSLGVPVVASRNSSLQEIAGTFSEYIEDPYSVESIAKSLSNAIKYPSNQREKIIEEGRKWLKNFSWERCGQQTWDVLQELVFWSKRQK